MKKVGVHLRISFRHLLMNFEKPKKSEFLKNKIKKPWRYHHFTHMCQKPQSGTVPEIWSNTNFFCYLRPFFALYCPLTPQKTKMIYGSWDIKCKGQSFLSFWAIFLPFDPPNKPKNQNPKKCLEILSFYTCVLQMTIMMYGSWYIKHDRQNFLSFLAIFCPFNPLTIQKIKTLKKGKKLLEILSFTQVYHKWQSYDIWFLRDQLQQIDFFLFSLAIFCPFTPLTFQKMKTSKNWKKHLEISSFYTSVPKIMIIGYTAPEIWCVPDVIVIFHFELFLTFHLPNSPKNENIKKWKKHLEISLYPTVPKIMIIDYTAPEIWCMTDVIVIFHFGLFFAPLPS